MTNSRDSKRIFGTNGVRGIIGQDMTPDLVYKISKTFGTMRRGRIALGRDSRLSGSTLAAAAKSGLLSSGCEVIDCGILPTPALQYIIKDRLDGGVMVTASHNPPEYNGIKIIEPDGTEMGDENTLKLEQMMYENSVPIVKWNVIGKESNSPQLLEYYVESIVKSFPKDIGNGMTVVVDPGSGPACSSTPKILTRMGCRVLTINGVIDGAFPGRLPEPSEGGLSALADLVKSSKAVMGLAHDGDADRTVFIDEEGRFVEENKEFAIIAQYICERKKGLIVTPVSTSLLVEMVAKEAGCRVEYTPVGSISVARTMRERIRNNENVIFGGEGNGGLIYPEHQFCRDGGMTAAMMVSILAARKMPLSSLIKTLPTRCMLKEKISGKNSTFLMKRIKRKFAGENIDLTDGLKIFRKNCWALIRASGTEPFIRVLIDGPGLEECNSFLEEIMSAISTC